MSRTLRKVLLIVLILVFAAAAFLYIREQAPYMKNKSVYREASENYTAPNKNASEGPSEDPSGSDEVSGLKAPITVDFEALKAVNSDIQGWIYCEGTAIDYPVLKGETDDSYIHTDYRGEYDFAGAIFVEALDLDDFGDANTIVYGHSMKDGSMFYVLRRWRSQSFADEHPYIWLLTPECDYRIEVFGAYVTEDGSDVYTIFREGGQQLLDYVNKAQKRSVIKTGVSLDADSKYILLSTCSRDNSDERTVVHGKMVPVRK